MLPGERRCLLHLQRSRRGIRGRAGSSPANIQSLKQQISEVLLSKSAHLAGPLKWQLSGVSGDSKSVSRGMELVWDGLRRWPYPLGEVAESRATVMELGMPAAERPDARSDQNVVQQLVERCLGEAIELEIGMEDSSYTRGYANRKLLRTAVRDDFNSLPLGPAHRVGSSGSSRLTGGAAGRRRRSKESILLKTSGE
jgi:hypothetical protein